MRRGVRGAPFALMALLGGGHAQQPLTAKTLSQLVFTFERAGLPVPKFSLSVDESGAGRYRASDGTETISREFTVSRVTAAKLFALTRDARIGPAVCASKAKNIADSGAKSLTYTADSATASCSYNYSENKDVKQLTAIFEGIAETMDEGRKLEHLHRFDRLGLDAEMTSFSQEVTAGRAVEMGTIVECLHSIADDPEVIQRVRTTAEKLVAAAPEDAQSR